MGKKALRGVLSVMILLLSMQATGVAAQQPVAVSPGSARGTLIADACPTFSWASVAGAGTYDLLVYRLGERGEEAELVLEQNFTGSVSSWTPSLAGCLEQGGQYAWSVRAVVAGQSTDWSKLNLFEVASGPSEVDFEEALQVVRQYLLAQGGADPLGVAETGAEVGPRTGGEPLAPSLAAADAASTKLSVDGGVAATSFTGDGSTLTSLSPANLAGAVGLDKGGTAATDAAGARTNLGVVAGPHTLDTDTTCLDGAVACNFAASASEGGAATSGDSATGFFTAGQIEEPRIADSIARDSEVIAAIATIDRGCPGALGSGSRYTDCGDGSVRDGQQHGAVLAERR